MGPMRHALASGAQIRLRLPQRADAAGVVALCERMGLQVDDVDVARMLRFDPRRRAVGCAVAWTGDCETVVGIGATELGTRRGPDLLLCDPAHPGLPPVLERWLAEKAAGRARRAA